MTPTTHPAVEKYGAAIIAQTTATTLLLRSPEAMVYLATRGIDRSLALSWHLGLWAPWVRTHLEDHYGIMEIDLNERSLDARLNNRITVPLTLPDGQTVALCGRSFPPLNTPPRWVYPRDSQYVEPRALLLGYHHIVKNNLPSFAARPVICQEGPFDVILSQKFGYGAVGLCGTSLTLEKALLLKALHRPIVLMPDPDEGFDPFLRNAARWTSHLPNMMVAKLKHGKDPASHLAAGESWAIEEALFDMKPLLRKSTK